MDDRYYFHTSDEEQRAEEQKVESQKIEDQEENDTYTYDEPVRKRKKNHGATVFTILLAVCVLASMGYYGFKYWNLFWGESTEIAGSRERLTLSEPSESEMDDDSRALRAAVLDVSDVVAEVLPSVVAITNTSIQEVEYWFRTMEFENVISGSGFIIAQTQDEMLIATNAHVVEDSTSLSVCFTVDGQEIDSETAIAEAVIKGMDKEYDLAVVSVAMSDIPENVRRQIVVAQLGVSSELEVGEPAIAIGNALGYGQSVTLGIVSALNREVMVEGNMNTYIQTDAAINEGNSGGVLLDVQGHVIGINSAKAAAYGVERMGYAIPIDDAKPILEDLMNKVTRTKVPEEEIGYLGISPRDISEEGRNLYNMPAGVFVYEVESGSPADQAGIQTGDIITRFDGNSVYSSERLSELMEYYASGETVEVELQNVTGGVYKTRVVQVTLG